MMPLLKFRKINFGKLTFIPASHEDKNDPGVLKKILFNAFDIPTEVKIQMINWARLLPNRSFKKHYHEDMDEIFIIISGKTRIVADNKETTLKKGDAVYIPYKQAHQMWNIAKDHTDYIAIGLSRGGGGKTVNL